MFESRNNHEAIIFCFYIFATTCNRLLLWKPKELGKNGIRAGSRLDLLWYIQGEEPFILWPGATTGYYGAPQSPADLLCDGWVLVVERYCSFFQSTNRLLMENVMVCCQYQLSYNRSPEEIQNIACFSECSENFK